jgi:hypothetical protein
MYAYMETEKYPKGHPQLANVAIGRVEPGKESAEDRRGQNRPEIR